MSGLLCSTAFTTAHHKLVPDCTSTARRDETQVTTAQIARSKALVIHDQPPPTVKTERLVTSDAPLATVVESPTEKPDEDIIPTIGLAGRPTSEKTPLDLGGPASPLQSQCPQLLMPPLGCALSPSLVSTRARTKLRRENVTVELNHKQLRD